MPTADRTRKDGTLTTRGFVTHKMVVVGPRCIYVPVAVQPSENGDLPEPMSIDGKYLYVFPGGKRMTLDGRTG